VRKRILSAALLGVVAAVLLWAGLHPPPALSESALLISDVEASAGSVPQFDKLELTFRIDNSVATNPQLPFDPSPPPGLDGRVGITVEALFLPPGATDWLRAVRQPAFLYQGYQRKLVDGKEWLYPDGAPTWMVRFAPPSAGAWQYLIRAQDASICRRGLDPCPSWAQSPVFGFTATSPRAANHGFVRVSQTDPRYFAFSDGTSFAGLGHDSGFDATNLTYDAETTLSRFAENGLDFSRIWMTGSTIAGSAWGPWVWLGGSGYGGYLQDPGLAVAPAGSGHDFVFNLSQSANRQCLMNGWSQGAVAVKPSTTYRLGVQAQVSNVAGPRDLTRPDFGLTVKLGGWSNNCPDDTATDERVLAHVRNTDWAAFQGTFTTGASEWRLPFIYLMLDNVTAGEANVSEMSLKEVLSDGSLGPELLAKSRGDSHMDYNQLRSWGWDYVLDSAAERGVYLKLVVLEKNDRVWTSIAADGTVAQSEDNANFYAAPGTKVRRLQEYYWRYLAARWGYSTAVHSWELLNEGDPFNGQHYEQANSFARYMHANEPSRHLVTTSFWHSFPTAQFWGSPAYADIDYADLHAYISTGLGAYEWTEPSGTTLETDPAKTYSGSASAIRLAAGTQSGSKGVAIRGRGDWQVSAMVRAENLTGVCPYGAPASLAGPQILVGLDVPNTRVIPYAPGSPDNYWSCTSPAGSYDYRQIEGVIPVGDDNWHTLNLAFKTSYATQGTAWFDNLEVRSPDGRLARVYGDGTFDDRERMDRDSALYHETYSRLDGAQSVSGPEKPVVRGEAGIDHDGGPQTELAEMASDLNGVWLHNFLWARLSPGGMYDLYWWTENIANRDLYSQFKPLRDFLQGIPLDNGRYVDIAAQASDPAVRVVGQIDAGAGRAHFWARNRDYTWWNVVNNVPRGSLGGTVTVPGIVAGRTVPVEFWQFDASGNLAKTQTMRTADSNGDLVIDLANLPTSVTDVAVRIGDYTSAYTVELSPVLK
jgi:hypothetical protein